MARPKGIINDNYKRLNDLFVETQFERVVAQYLPLGRFGSQTMIKPLQKF